MKPELTPDEGHKITHMRHGGHAELTPACPPTTSRSTSNARSPRPVANGCHDQLSGVRDDRPGLAAPLDYARTDDTVVVVALDRLGRSLSGIIRTVETLTEAGVLLCSLREGIDYSTVTGRMLAGIFAALAAYERELMHERAAAKAHGRHTGRPPKLTEAQGRQIRALRGRGESISDLVAGYGVSRATIYRALNAATEPTPG